MFKDHRLPARFWSKVALDTVTGCWLWVASKNEHGYGWYGKRRVVYKAHRVAYEDLVGPIPDGLVLDRLCRTPACVNPEHLEPVTQGENMRRSRGYRERKSHCPRGHEYAGENLYVNKLGRYVCRICARASMEAFLERRQA